jgi:hypothetical protein
MFRIYRIFAGIPTRNQDFLRGADTITEAMEFLPLYEQENGFAVAIYEVEPNGRDETLAYFTVIKDVPPYNYNQVDRQHHRPAECDAAEPELDHR